MLRGSAASQSSTLVQKGRMISKGGALWSSNGKHCPQRPPTQYQRQLSTSAARCYASIPKSIQSLVAPRSYQRRWVCYACMH
eukprot:2625999-Rhodomonas_salina.1